MHIQVTREEFLNALAQIQGVIETKKSLPILSHLLLEAKEGLITLSGTDLDVSIQTSLHGDVKRGGGIAVSAKKLYEIVRELPDAPIDLQWDGNQQIEILCAKTSFRLKVVTKEEFPSLPQIPGKGGFTITTDPLRKMIQKTIFAVSTDQTRPTLSGALLQMSETGVRMVATDGHRLSLVKASPEAVKGGGPVEALIPRKALGELSKMLREEEGEVQVVPLNQQMAFLLGKTLLTTRLIEGQFPNYQQVLPTAGGPGATLNRDGLLGALRRTSTIVGDRATPTILEMKQGRLLISCTNIDLGEAREDLPMEYRGQELTVGFNARYLMDFLNAVDEGEVSMHIHDPLSPALFTPRKEEGFCCVIMPMRT
jgi:DNA polymerase-3 subunit beta